MPSLQPRFVFVLSTAGSVMQRVLDTETVRRAVHSAVAESEGPALEHARAHGVPTAVLPSQTNEIFCRNLLDYVRKHEIDYILFARVDSSDIPSLKPNPDEVDDVRWVTKDELVKMMKPESGLLWSPWFRILTNRFLLPKWWKDLDVTMNTDTHVDVDTVHRFDPTKEHMGGQGKAGPWLDLLVSNEESK